MSAVIDKEKQRSDFHNDIAQQTKTEQNITDKDETSSKKIHNKHQSTSSSESDRLLIDSTNNIKFVMIIAVITVVVIALVSLMKIYIDQKQFVIHELRVENNSCVQTHNYYIKHHKMVSKHVHSILKKRYSGDFGYYDIRDAQATLIDYIISDNLWSSFGLNVALWIDWNDNMVGATILEEHILDDMRDMLKKDKTRDLTFYFSTKKDKMFQKTMYIASDLFIKDNVYDKVFPPEARLLNNTFNFGQNIYRWKTSAGRYLGTLVIGFNVYYWIEEIEFRNRYNQLSFALLDDKFNLVYSYPIHSSHRSILDSKAFRSQSKDKNLIVGHKPVAYIDLISGDNFYIQRIDDSPFYMVTSFDTKYIRNVIATKITVRFIEISAATILCLILVVLVYKNEKSLRTKAEKASFIALKAMNAKSDFLSYVAHEIRSPLGFIMTGSEIMNTELLGPIPKMYQEYVNGIYHNSKLILELVNDILDEKHIVSGNFRMNTGDCDIVGIMHRAIEINKTRFHHRKIEVAFEYQDNVPTVFGDPKRLLQVFNNIISNAYKYSFDSTEINISINHTQHHVVVTIKDHGIGMTEEELRSACAKQGAVQNHNRIDNWTESYGLGLSIVKMLLNAHNAILHIDSELDQGTTVRILLPIRSKISEWH